MVLLTVEVMRGENYGGNKFSIQTNIIINGDAVLFMNS